MVEYIHMGLNLSSTLVPFGYECRSLVSVIGKTRIIAKLSDRVASVVEAGRNFVATARFAFAQRATVLA